MNQFKRIGFIGLGVMGEPICRNLASKSRVPLVAYDLNPEPLQRLRGLGVQAVPDVGAIMAESDIVFLSLPSGEIVDKICRDPLGLLMAVKPGQIVVDTSTSPLDITRALAADFAKREAIFIDAPVARTRAAAEAGTLSVMVGGDKEVFERVRPLIATFATDITLCGPTGSGQVVKILNNMVLFETVVAISEAKAIAERSGVDAALLFDTLSKGSGDSFALRNHGMKAVIPDNFPERAFSVRYARKDLDYSLRLARDGGVDARGAKVVEGWFEEAIEAGFGDQYHPVISRCIGR